MLVAPQPSAQLARLRRVDITPDRAWVSWMCAHCSTTGVIGPSGSQKIHALSCAGPHGGPGLLNFVCPNPKKKKRAETGGAQGTAGGGGGGGGVHQNTRFQTTIMATVSQSMGF